MKLALVGTGQMGQAVEALVAGRGHEVGVRFNSGLALKDSDPSAVEDVAVAIDFSLPSLAVAHIERYCQWGLPAVIGTTGWYEHLHEVERLVDEHDASILYAPNFSLGIAVMVRALKAITPLLDQLPEYDPFVHEIHHVRKVDSPSGTASMIADLLVHDLGRKKRIETEAQHGRIDDEALHVTSTRVGEVFGKHVIGFDSAYDRIELVHEAKNRHGFALGAIRAAEWLKGRKGLFSLDDVLADWLGRQASAISRPDES
jgi:4-hydroxy-tetrahydrodipicolinate reductase